MISADMYAQDYNRNRNRLRLATVLEVLALIVFASIALFSCETSVICCPDDDTEIENDSIYVDTGTTATDTVQMHTQLGVEPLY